MAKGRKTKRARTPEEEVFHVEVVKKARVVPAKDEDTDDEKDGNKKKKKEKQKNTQSKAPAKWEYFVKWAGYDEEANSWEPEENLEACSRLLQSFWNHIGTDNDDYQIGHEVKAKKDWIEKEKAFFAKEYQTAQEELKRQEKEGNRNPKKKKKKVKHTPSEEPPIPAESSKKKSGLSQPLPPPSEPGSSSEDEPPLISLKIKIPAGSQTKRKRVISSPSSEEEPLLSSQRPKSNKIPKLNDPSTEAAKTTTPSPDSPTSLFSRPSSPIIAATKIPVKESMTGSITNKPLTPGIPPATVVRQSNPHVKIANMSSGVTSTASGISTKQRLAQGALAPTAPKEVGKVPPKPKPPLPTRKPSTNLNNLSFKKNKAPSLTIPSTTVDQTDTFPSTFRSPINEATFAPLNSPSLQSPHPTSLMVSFAEPMSTSTTTVPALPAGSSILRRRPSVLEPTISPAVLTQSPSMIEVDHFLDSLMPEKLAAPLEPAVERPLEPVPKPIHARIPLPGRIPKMWKWSGPLFYKFAQNPLCKVTMHVPPNAVQGIGLRFSMIFQGLEKIEVNYMYDYSDIRSIVPAFRKPPQLALLGPEGEEDVSKFRVIFHYMEKQQRVFMVPIHLDDNVIGYTIFFPYSLGLGLFGVQPPSEYSEPGTLVVAILPYALSQEQIKVVPRTPETQLRPTLQQGPKNRPIAKYPRYHRATKILGFPEALRKFLSDPAYVRPFAVWPDPESRTTSMKDRQSLETGLLLNILENGQRNASSKSDVRVAFIHIGSLHQIHKFPEFAERRTKSYIQFYTYGTHYDVPPDMWAVREIYPCGGIITFTPAAMHRDPIKVRQLIIQIGRHPLWECYILPTSLGLLTQIECGTNDPVLRLERKELMMGGILQSIEDGEVALMQAPPERPIVTQQKDERANWASQYVNFFPPTKIQALEAGIMAFVQNPGLGRSKDVIEKVIVKDLSMMQRHPALMTSYRRFVIINLEAEGSRCGEFYEGFEWTSASKFDFRDDFYPKQTIGMH